MQPLTPSKYQESPLLDKENRLSSQFLSPEKIGKGKRPRKTGGPSNKIGDVILDLSQACLSPRSPKAPKSLFSPSQDCSSPKPSRKIQKLDFFSSPDCVTPKKSPKRQESNLFSSPVKFSSFCDTTSARSFQTPPKSDSSSSCELDSLTPYSSELDPLTPDDLCFPMLQGFLLPNTSPNGSLANTPQADGPQTDYSLANSPQVDGPLAESASSSDEQFALSSSSLDEQFTLTPPLSYKQEATPPRVRTTPPRSLGKSLARGLQRPEKAARVQVRMNSLALTENGGDELFISINGFQFPVKKIGGWKSKTELIAEGKFGQKMNVEGNEGKFHIVYACDTDRLALGNARVLLRADPGLGCSKDRVIDIATIALKMPELKPELVHDTQYSVYTPGFISKDDIGISRFLERQMPLLESCGMYVAERILDAAPEKGEEGIGIFQLMDKAISTAGWTAPENCEKSYEQLSDLDRYLIDILMKVFTSSVGQRTALAGDFRPANCMWLMPEEGVGGMPLPHIVDAQIPDNGVSEIVTQMGWWAKGNYHIFSDFIRLVDMSDLANIVKFEMNDLELCKCTNSSSEGLKEQVYQALFKRYMDFTEPTVSRIDF